MAERAIRSANLEKLQFALEQYIAYLTDEIALKEIDERIGRDLESKAKALYRQFLDQQIEEKSAGDQLESLIDGLNARLVTLKAAHLFPLFPQEVSIILVQNHIIAFELSLSQKLRLNLVSLEKEAPLFERALNLWRDVGIRRTQKEVMVELANLIAELNMLLSPDKAYPLPSPELY